MTVKRVKKNHDTTKHLRMTRKGHTPKTKSKLRARKGAARGGRPSTYNPGIAEQILIGIASGRSLRQVCSQSKHLPDRRTVFRWLDINEEFKAAYYRAREMQFEHWADQILDIADDGSNDYYIGEDGKPHLDYDHVQRSKLRIESRKWLLSKLHPRQYGDRTETVVVGSKDKPVAVTRVLDESEIREVLETLAESGALPDGRGKKKTIKATVTQVD